MKSIQIGTRMVGEGHPCYVIAEAGINHQGDVNIAKKLIDAAVLCGADAVKFQKRTVTRILTKEGLDMPYDNANSFGKTYGEHKYALELSEDEYRSLKSYCDDKGIIFMASGWDEESIDFLDSLGMAVFKMASADLTNIPLLRHTARKGKPMILSTGMADMETVQEAYDIVTAINPNVIILQCTSTYPSAFEDINLNVIKTYQEKFDCPIGYSGHERGISISASAVALGACVVERHFTLDRTMKGGDHAASLEIPGFQKMVRDIRNVQIAMGSYEKKLLDSELKCKQKLAKSLVSKVAIPKGTVITVDMLTTKGPGKGLAPKYIDIVPGKVAAEDIPADIVLYEHHIVW